MTPAGQTRLARLRALCAVLFLLAAALSAPVALATQTADVCGMACCVEEGHCCCSPSHAYVEGQVPDGKPHLSESELSASCPESCAPAARFSNLLLRDQPRPAAPHTLDEQASLIYLDMTVAVHDPIESGPSSPRSPPVSSQI